MRKNFIKTLFAMTMVVATVSTTGLTAQAAETKTEAATETQATKITLTAASKAALKTVFDAKYYAETYPDVAAVVGTDSDKLFAHYVDFGINEGRDASEKFNASFYVLANPDLEAIYGDNVNGYVTHYVNCGIKENRIASPVTYASADASVRKSVSDAIKVNQATKAASGTTSAISAFANSFSTSGLGKAGTFTRTDGTVYSEVNAAGRTGLEEDIYFRTQVMGLPMPKITYGANGYVDVYYGNGAHSEYFNGKWMGNSTNYVELYRETGYNVAQQEADNFKNNVYGSQASMSYTDGTNTWVMDSNGVTNTTTGEVTSHDSWVSISEPAMNNTSSVSYSEPETYVVYDTIDSSNWVVIE